MAVEVAVPFPGCFFEDTHCDRYDRHEPKFTRQREAAWSPPLDPERAKPPSSLYVTLLGFQAHGAVSVENVFVSFSQGGNGHVAGEIGAQAGASYMNHLLSRAIRDKLCSFRRAPYFI